MPNIDDFYPSKFLRASDLKGKEITVTIDRVEAEEFEQDGVKRTKPVVHFRDKGIKPLVLNRTQKRFILAVLKQWQATGRVRFVVLKARQQGFSTVISAFGYWWLSQHPAQKGLVMAHEADSTTTLFDMYRRIHDNVPTAVRPSTKYSSRTELVFDRLDSSLRVATAGGRGVARGETIQVAHRPRWPSGPPRSLAPTSTASSKPSLRRKAPPCS